MMSGNLFSLKIDDSSFFSFHLEKDDVRIDNDGWVYFNIGKNAIECGNGPLVYGEQSGIVDEMILYIKWVLSSAPIDLDLRDRVGAYYYQNCLDLVLNKKVSEYSEYMFTSGIDSIVWLYRTGENEYCFEVTTGSRFTDPETAFQKVHGGVLDKGNLKQWLTELERLKKDLSKIAGRC